MEAHHGHQRGGDTQNVETAQEEQRKEIRDQARRQKKRQRQRQPTAHRSQQQRRRCPGETRHLVVIL